MLKFCKIIWNDPVWSKVISVGIIGAIVQYFFPWFQLVIKLPKKLYIFSLQSSEISNWLFMLMALCTTLFLMALMVILWQIIKPKDSTTSWKENYRQDIFFNILWRWDYSYDAQVEHLFSFCPKCDFQIHAENSSAFEVVPRISFYCENCGKTVYEYAGRYTELESQIIRSLQLKIRKGTWKTQTESNT